MSSRAPRGRAALLAMIAIGAGVGVIAGLFGIGGGALLIVGLVTLGFSQHAAHATSLAAIILTAGAAVIPFALAGEVALAAAVVLAPAAMAGAFVGAGVMRHIPEDRLRIAFVVFIMVVGLRMLVGVETAGVPTELGPWQFAGLGALGLGVGVLSAIMGVGGGIVFVPALVLLFGFGQHAAEGTSLAVMIPTAFVGALRHSRSQYTSWRTGMILGLSGVLGGLGGAQFALLLEGVTLQRLFAVFLFVMGIRLLRERKPAPPAPPAEPAQ